MQLLTFHEPSLTTDLSRPMWTDDPSVVKAVDEGSAREGSQSGAMVVPGIRWKRSARGHVVSISGTETVQRLLKVVHARLAFGRQLLLHDYDEAPFSEIGIEPSHEFFVREHGDRMLILGVSADDPRFTMAAEAKPQVEWRFEK